MKELIFNTPWWLPTAIAFVGVFLFLSGNRRQLTGMRSAGLGVALLAIVLAAVSYSVQTDEELVLQRTSDLVAAFDKQDWTKFRSLLDEKTSLGRYNGRDMLVLGAQAASLRFGIKKVRILSRELRHDDSLMTVSLTVYSEQNLPPAPLTTHWELDWQQRGKQWLLYRVTSVGKEGGMEQNVLQHLPPVRTP